MRREGGGGFGMRRHEDLAHVIAHLERVRTDGGPHPGQDVSRCHPHHSDRGFQHAASQAAPAGMGGSHDAAGAVAEQHRQAVRSQHRADLPGFARERRIGFGIRLASELDHPGAVYLPEPTRLRGQLLAKVRTVGGDVIRIVADMVAEIEAGPGGPAHAAGAGGQETLDPRGCGPVGDDQVHLTQSVFARSAARSEAKSGGSGHSHCMNSWVTGWIRPSLSACSAWRGKGILRWLRRLAL